MKSLLVLGQSPFEEAVRTALDAASYRVLWKAEPGEADSLLRLGFTDVVVVEAQGIQPQLTSFLARVRHLVPNGCVVVYAEASPWEGEEEAYVAGADHVLFKPVRPRLLNALLQRSEIPPSPPGESVATPPIADHPETIQALDQSPSPLAILRDFSKVLRNSLQAEVFIDQFLWLLREIVSLNRAAVFFYSAPARPSGKDRAVHPDDLFPAGTMGIPSALAEHFTLSHDFGIGDFIAQRGRVLVRNSPEAQRDRMIQKEFAVWDMQVAIPIQDRATVVGVALFDHHLTGEPLTRDELHWLCLLFDQLGAAVWNGVTITPVRKDLSSPAVAALVVAEGGKPESSRLTIAPKSGRASLIKTMAAHLAHEIGNSLAPLSTYQQLAPREFENADFRASFIAAVGEGIKRLSRLVTQMHYLSHDLTDRDAVFSVSVLIKKAIAEAKANFPDKTPSIQLEDADGFLTLAGDSAALQHALAEVLLNAFQASPANPQAHLRLQHAGAPNGGQQLHIVIQDAGPGFTPDLVQRLGEPFFSSRKVGMGLGLAVARKIIEIHKGNLEILPSQPGQHGAVRISLPLSNEV